MSVYGGVGNPIGVNAKENMCGYRYMKKPFPQKPDPNNPIDAIPLIDYEAFLQISYLPIRISVDLDFLYDFLNKDDYSLGLTVGIGYRFGYYLNQNGRFSGRAQSNYPTSSASVPIAYSNTMADIKMENFMIHDLYPQIGLHYYLGHHQFEFLVRFDGLLNFQSPKDEVLEIKGGSGEVYQYERVKIRNINPLSLNYVYRF